MGSSRCECCLLETAVVCVLPNPNKRVPFILDEICPSCAEFFQYEYVFELFRHPVAYTSWEDGKQIWTSTLHARKIA